MMNLFSIVGKLVKKPYSITDNNGNNKYYIQIESNRNFKESTFELKKDIYEIELWRGIYETVAESTNIGENLIIKGRFISDPLVVNEQVIYTNQLIAELVDTIK